MAYIPQLDSLISTGNSTITSISGAAVFTGVADDVSNFSTVTIMSFSNQDSAVGGLQLQFSQDGVNWDHSELHSTFANSSFETSHLVTAKYFRVVYTNGSSAQTTFRLQVIYHKQKQPVITSPDNSAVSVLNSSSTILGVSGVFTGISEDVSQYATITLTSFSDEDSAVSGLQMQFSSDGINWDITKAHTVEASEAHEFTHLITAKYFRVIYTNGSTLQGDFRLQVIYHTHKSPLITDGIDQHIDSDASAILARSVLTGRTTGDQFINVAVTPENALCVEVVGPNTSFGELLTAEGTPVIQADFIYNINTDIVNEVLTGSGAITQANSLASITTTANTNSSAALATNRYLKYRPGQGGMARFTAIFTTGVTGSNQQAGIGLPTDGFFFGFDEATFGILRTNNSVQTWTAQTAWNVDVMDGTKSTSNPSGMLLDPTKGNVYEIAFQWLGFGAINYGIEDPATGRFVVVHRIQYANNNTETSVRNPSFPICFFAENTTNNTNIVVKTSSCAAFIQGKVVLLGPRNSQENTKTGVGTTLTNILTIRNKTTFQSITNQVPVIMSFLSAAVDGTKPAKIEMWLNTTLGGTPSYTDHSANTSVIDYDTAGTTLTGGTNKGTFTLSKAGSLAEILKDLDIVLIPGDTLTFAAHSTAGTTDVTVSPIWIEDF